MNGLLFRLPCFLRLSLIGLVCLSPLGGACQDNLPPPQSCDEAMKGRFKITGTYDDVTDTREIFEDQTYQIAETVKKIQYHVVLDLETPVGSVSSPGTSVLKGTATVSWSRHTYNVNRTQCSPGSPVIQYRDYEDRHWVVNISATLSCGVSNGTQKTTLSGSGSPDGSEVGQFYHITENCTSFTRDGQDNARESWSSFGPITITENEDLTSPTFGQVTWFTRIPIADGLLGDHTQTAQLVVTKLP